MQSFQSEVKDKTTFLKVLESLADDIEDTETKAQEQVEVSCKLWNIYVVHIKVIISY